MPTPTYEETRDRSRPGASRAQIEGVRVAASERGNALGAHLISWCIAKSREWNCQVVQLTSDKTRTDAHRFYERCGFVPTHEGFKLDLSDQPNWLSG